MIYRQDFYNLQTRKKSEMVQTVQIDFSINGNTTRSQIWMNTYVTGHLWDMLYNLLIQFTDWQSGWKSPWTIYRPAK